MSLASRLSLVTGGGSGIGRAVCQLFAKEGASVAVVGNNLSTIEETVCNLRDIAKKEGHIAATFHPIEVDVSNSGHVDSLFSSLEDVFTTVPPLSILVNGAGVTRDALLLKQTEEDFEQVLNVNLKGTFLMTQAAARCMVRRKVRNGSIVNIASIVGKIGNVGQANYSASKGGVMAMTLTCAKELGRYGIRCNTVLPGYIDTPMIAHVPPKFLDNVVKMIPLGRTGTPEEVAELCAFLASNKSSYITGAHFEITGGLNF